MQRLDAIVAIAGGVILLVAIVAAAVNGGGAGSDYRMTFAIWDHKSPPVTKSPVPDRNVASFVVNDANMVDVTATVLFDGLVAYPATTTAHVVLAAPNGTKAERTFAPLPSGGSFGGGLSLDARAPPPNGTITATSSDDALRQARIADTTDGQGNWTVEVDFSTGAPSLPGGLPNSDSSVTLSWRTWDARVESLAVPTSK